MGVIIFNWLIEYIVKDIPVLFAVIGAGYWFSRQTKKGLNARIDDHEKECRQWRREVSDKFTNIHTMLAEIKAEIRLERRMSKMEEKLEGNLAGE